MQRPPGSDPDPAIIVLVTAEELASQLDQDFAMGRTLVVALLEAGRAFPVLRSLCIVLYGIYYHQAGLAIARLESVGAFALRMALEARAQLLRFLERKHSLGGRTYDAAIALDVLEDLVLHPRTGDFPERGTRIRGMTHVAAERLKAGRGRLVGIVGKDPCPPFGASKRFLTVANRPVRLPHPECFL
ncbi:MAG TPA: hypothetical protein VLV83_23000 [Acidobacteriota bacterium]|nr:hypothetical protein [Acidobacteriota bacterium]